MMLSDRRLARIIYEKLMGAYGPQGWWPLTPEGRTRTEHHAGPPKNDLQRFEIILGAILTQNTAWKNVENALEQLKKEVLVDPEKLVRQSHEKIGQLIRSAGYYNQKAERLKTISRFILENPIKILMKKDTQELRQIFLNIKGIGPETADSILLYAFGKPSFVVDTYTKRIFSRLGFCREDIEYHALKSMFEDSLKAETGIFQEYHALIVEHAKRHCTKRPVCEDCPIQKDCISV